jgi:hypothetical protein
VIDDINSKIPVSIDLLLLLPFLLAYNKLIKINMPTITTRNKMIGNVNRKRIPVPTAIPVHLSSLLAEFLLS